MKRILRSKKQYNQNVLDFIITNYGSIDYIGQFIADNNFGEQDLYETFKNIPVGTELMITTLTEQQKNRTYKEFEKSNYSVVTGDKPPFVAFEINLNAINDIDLTITTTLQLTWNANFFGDINLELYYGDSLTPSQTIIVDASLNAYNWILLNSLPAGSYYVKAYYEDEVTETSNVFTIFNYEYINIPVTTNSTVNISYTGSTWSEMINATDGNGITAVGNISNNYLIIDVPLPFYYNIRSFFNTDFSTITETVVSVKLIVDVMSNEHDMQLYLYNANYPGTLATMPDYDSKENLLGSSIYSNGKLEFILDNSVISYNKFALINEYDALNIEQFGIISYETILDMSTAIFEIKINKI